MANDWDAMGFPNGYVRGTLQEEPEADIARFKPEVGAAELREMSTVVHVMVSFDVLFPADRWQALLDFYYTKRAQVWTRRHPDGWMTGDRNWQFEAQPRKRDANATFIRVTLSLRMMP